MKKTHLALTTLFCLSAIGTASAAESSAVATWSATAKKDTTSALVVTPLNSLTFDYAAGIGANGSFNTQKGLFDVRIEGDATAATGFTLKAQKVSSTITHLSDPSTLDVGVLWNGQRLDNSAYVMLIDTAAGVDGLNLSPIASNYNVAGSHTAQESFTFDIQDGTLDGTTSIAGEFNTLPDGLWQGEVKVKFVAEWL